jgi:hypothetical protein
MYVFGPTTEAFAKAVGKWNGPPRKNTRMIALKTVFARTFTV